MPVGKGRVALQRKDFSVDEELDRLICGSTGGTVIFVGSTRGSSERGPVRHLDFESFGPMAAKSLEMIRRQAMDRFGAGGITVIHRTGRIRAGKRIVMVAASAAHRDQAFKACRFVLERLKKDVPIWKKERGVWSGPDNERNGAARKRARRRQAAGKR